MRRLMLIVFGVVLFGGSLVVVWQVISRLRIIPITSPLPAVGEIQTSSALITPPFKSSGNLTQVIEQGLEWVTGDYAIVVKNLKTGEEYGKQADKIYEPASLYKLWVMATVYEQIAIGNISPDQVLSGNISGLNAAFQIPPGEAELIQGSITMTVEEALEKMITISHNYASLLLVQKIRFSAVRDFLKRNQLNRSTVGNNHPETTAADIALFFEKLVAGKLADSEVTEKMLTLLKNQELNHKLPKYLPQMQVVAHKTGELGRFTHDAGIVFLPDTQYIIVVLSESDNPVSAEDRIARISEAVYKYFTN